jgi:hypothetical protein
MLCYVVLKKEEKKLGDVLYACLLWTPTLDACVLWTSILYYVVLRKKKKIIRHPLCVLVVDVNVVLCTSLYVRVMGVMLYCVIKKRINQDFNSAMLSVAGDVPVRACSGRQRCTILYVLVRACCRRLCSSQKEKKLGDIPYVCVL